MKNKGLIITLIIIILLGIVGLCILLFGMITGGISKVFSESYIEEKIVDEVYDSNLENIEIEYDVAKVTINESDSNNIKLVIYGEEDKTNVKVIDNKLYVETKTKKCVGFCINRKKAKVELYVPSDYQNNIETKGNVGDIKVGKFENLKLDSQLDVGDIDIDSVDSAKIKVATGDVKIDTVNVLDIDGKVGDIKVENINNKLDISIKTGDVKINKANIISDSTIKTKVGDVKIQETNDIYVSAKSKVGDVNVNSNRKSDIELKIETNVGDIKANI